MTKGFPVRGLVGVLAGSGPEVEKLLETMGREGPGGPDAVEIRADLLGEPRHGLELARRLPRGLPWVFTVRVATQGGRFTASESSRIALYREALALGASLVDAEWGTEAARALARDGAPLVASHHDFSAMPPPADVQRVTAQMEELKPLVVKLVPTAETPRDAIEMLRWTAEAPHEGPRRVGFAMGEMGLLTRILSIPWGAPYTYASLGAAVAPGQVPLRDLRRLYRPMEVGRSTSIFAVAAPAGSPLHEILPRIYNRFLAARGANALCVPVPAASLDDFLPVLDGLPVRGVAVGSPYEEQALRLAERSDRASRAAAAANTLIVESIEGRRRVTAAHTGPQGLLEPLRRRGVCLQGLSAAVLGSSGRARAAVTALLGSGALVTIYAEEPHLAPEATRALGPAVKSLESLGESRYGLIVRAADDRGADRGRDTSPSDPPRRSAASEQAAAAEARAVQAMARAVLDSSTVVVDLVPALESSPFLESAARRGAMTVPPREPLLAGAAAQLSALLGAEVSVEDLEPFLDSDGLTGPD